MDGSSLQDSPCQVSEAGDEHAPSPAQPPGGDVGEGAGQGTGQEEAGCVEPEAREVAVRAEGDSGGGVGAPAGRLLGGGCISREELLHKGVHGCHTGGDGEAVAKQEASTGSDKADDDNVGGHSLRLELGPADDLAELPAQPQPRRLEHVTLLPVAGEGVRPAARPGRWHPLGLLTGGVVPTRSGPLSRPIASLPVLLLAIRVPLHWHPHLQLVERYGAVAVGRGLPFPAVIAQSPAPRGTVGLG
mmetsp:Transcript_29510/g.83239  ORF Transcript_29510/g.83239 Transcript_29510/m.83239 type:complete len:245 (+) Transcript_29510:1470-2204(+)